MLEAEEEKQIPFLQGISDFYGNCDRIVFAFDCDTWIFCGLFHRSVVVQMKKAPAGLICRQGLDCYKETKIGS